MSMSQGWLEWQRPEGRGQDRSSSSLAHLNKIHTPRFPSCRGDEMMGRLIRFFSLTPWSLSLVVTSLNARSHAQQRHHPTPPVLAKSMRPGSISSLRRSMVLSVVEILSPWTRQRQSRDSSCSYMDMGNEEQTYPSHMTLLSRERWSTAHCFSCSYCSSFEFAFPACTPLL
jgi:hypothetical protein